MRKKVILLILDGFGIAEKNITNPFKFVQTPNLDYLKKNYPYLLLNASGLSVGLPVGQAASCEIGHLTLGTGIIYYQNLTRIDLAIESGEFFENEKFKIIFNHLKKYNSRLHLIGLLSQGFTQASFNHLLALLKLCQKENFSDVYLHLFTDGIDSEPRSALKLLEILKNEIKLKNLPGKIASLCGRFYALDETQNYILKTQKTFLLLTKGIGIKVDDPFIYLERKYQDTNFTDDLLEPVLIDQNGVIEDNDALLFFNFENKSILQLARAFLDPNFKEFKREEKRNLLIASLTRYSKSFDYLVIFEEGEILMNLSRILAENGLSQFKIIDATREKLFRFYFNGFIQEEHPHETFKILPPFEGDFENLKQRTEEMLNILKLIIREKFYDFILVNLPLFDIAGHSSSFQLAIKVIDEVDQIIGHFYEEVLKNNYTLIITSDHGNIEKMVESKKGIKITSHDPNPVPFYLIDDDFKKEKTEEELAFFENKILGNLYDVAPTILELFNIPQPKEFIGKSLLRYFR